MPKLTMMLWRAVILALAVVCSETVALASIVLVRSSDAVVIAADAKRAISPGRSIQTCKIEKEGNCFFAAAGVAFGLAAGLDIREFAGRACQQTGSIAEKPALLERLVWEPISVALRRMGAGKSEQYRKAVNTKIVEVAFAGEELGSAKASLATFYLNEDGSLLMLSQDLSGSPPSGAKQFFTLGVTGDSARVVQSPRTAGGSIVDDTLAPEEFARSYLDLSIERAGKAAGPPVAVLKIDQSGPHWIETGACTATEK